MWDTQSNASGAFTRYGDVTPLLQNADDMFVIGRQGDQVNMQFSTANLTAASARNGTRLLLCCCLLV